MGNVVVSQFVSLDGVFEDPGGSEHSGLGAWTFRFNRGPEGDQLKVDEVMAAGALLLGRVTYQGFAAAWPSITDEAGFADKMNSMPKYVVSTTLERADWNNSTIISGNVADEVRMLKERVDGDILINGSGRLVRTLMEHGLIDEYRLMVFPIVLGGGKRLFVEAAKATTLRLTETRKAGDCLILIYRPARTTGDA